MTFDWVDYLNLAVYLRGEAKNDSSMNEAMHRTSISRAYYSSFNLIKNCLISMGEILGRGAEVHKEIQTIFEDLSKQEMDSIRRRNLIEISNELGVLRSFRNKADYNNAVFGMDKLVEASIIRAQKVKALVQAL